MGPSTILDPPPAAPHRAGRPRDRLAAHALASDVARTHGEALMRTARKFAGDPDDAHDAYQRALELLLEHAATIDRAKVLPWMHVVVRREASALRRRHDRHLPLDIDAVDHRHVDDRTDDELSRIDLAQRAGEALAALKETEAQALCLRAQGLSYEEIGEAYGWSYTKVNRAVSEGRRAFVDHYLGAERGEVCDQAGSRIGQYLAGELRPRDQVRLRAHLTRCSSCRAQLHAERGADRALQALLPPAAIGTSTSGGWAHDHIVAPLADLAARLAPAADHALSAKIGAVAVSAIAIAGGGATINHEITSHQPPPPAVRTALTGGSPNQTTTTSTSAASAPAANAINAATSGSANRITQSERRAASRRKAAAARRKTAAARAKRRTAAAREFAPAATEFSGSATTGSSRSGTSGGGSRSGGTNSNSTTASAPQSAPAEVPIDAPTSDSGISVTDESQTP